MNSRERLLAALNHQEPDRVPLDLGGNQTGIHRIAYKNLLEALEIEEEIQNMDVVQQLAAPSETVLRRFEIDTRYVRPGMFCPAPELKEVKPGYWGFTDGFGVTWAMPGKTPGEGLYCDIIHHPLAHASYADLDHYDWPSGKDFSPFQGLRAYAANLSDETPYALVSGITGVVFEICWYMRGFERLYMDMLEQPRFVEKLLEHTLVYWKDFLEVFLGEVGDYLQVLCVGDDVGMQSGPLFSPSIHRSLVHPYQRELYQFIHQKTSAKLWYHSCGAVRRYIPDLIESGVDILNPIQISAKDMDPAELKEEYGEQICFWGGGIDTQHVFPKGSPDEVRAQVQDLMRIFKPGGGYVFNTIHNIQADVPPQNIIALWEAARKYGRY
ncbi:MAG: uroporphyrinogen decarboxylase family protein [bacterium]|jgi:uroporphyrinogen decarboxylase|nr:uroporphyrinogen decarboxylase family protein [bacterium]